MGNSNSADVIVNSQEEVDSNATGRLQVQYFALHGRALHLKVMLYYANVDFDDEHVSTGGFIKRKVCGPLKYGTLPKLKLENGTLLHQSGSIARYIGSRFKGCKGECLYPPANDPMGRFWADVLLEEITPVMVEFHELVKDLKKGNMNTSNTFFSMEGQFEKYCCVLEDAMEKCGNKKYLISDCITMADCVTFA